MSDEDVWQRFLARPVGGALTPELSERVRSRAPFEDREPSVALFEVLVAFHMGALRRDELENVIEENEQLDRSIELKERRGMPRRGLRLVRS